MEEPTYTIAYIDQYLSGQLTDDEASQFEIQMDQDAELQKSVKEVIRAKATTYLAGREAWKGEMHQKFEEHLRPPKFSFLPLIVAAIGAIFLILTGIWWFQQNNKLSSEKIFAQVYQVPAAPEYRGEGIDSMLVHGFGAYNRGDYPSALQSFDQLLSQDNLPHREEVAFYKGIALIEVKQEPEALEVLSLVRGEQYGESARFYEAILLLKQGKTDSAKAVLHDLLEFEGTYESRVEEVLEMLRGE